MLRLLVATIMLFGANVLANIQWQVSPHITRVVQHTVIRSNATHETNLYHVSMITKAADEQRRRERYAQLIQDKYRVGEEIATQVVELAHKHQRETFPRARDIIAVIGIESSFNEQARSQLENDPALGLMQIRARVWKLSPDELLTADKNIEHGASILEHYYQELGKKDCAIQAYNRGITAYKQGGTSLEYLDKFKREVALYR